jgi:hypothetical protein
VGDSNGSLTLEGLAQILRDHMDGTAARFAEVGARIDELRGDIGLVATLVRDLGQIVTRHHDELQEHRQQILRIYARMEQHDARMEQHDARFEAISREIREMGRDIRRILTPWSGAGAMAAPGRPSGRREIFGMLFGCDSRDLRTGKGDSCSGRAG